MKILRTLWNALLLTTAVLLICLNGRQPSSEKTPFDTALVSSVEAAPQRPLRVLVDESCGICHNNLHLPTRGDFSLAGGADSHRPGVFARALGLTDPTSMTNEDPDTSMIVRKPLDGSGTPHAGPKIPATHETMIALRDWVRRGAPVAEMNYPAGETLRYKNVAGNTIQVAYSRRRHRKGGFNDHMSSTPGGNIHRLTFNCDGSAVQILEDRNLTNLPSTDDAQSPSVSLDGSKVVFARKQPGDNWQIWECSADGGNLRQITRGPGNKIQPTYLPYTADGEPARAGEGGIVYLSDVGGFLDEYDQAVTRSLHVCDKDGNNERMIDPNPSHQLHPTRHSSGLLIYTRWEHNELQGHNFMPLFQLGAANWKSAGTMIFGAYGEHFTSAAGNSLHESEEILGVDAYKAMMIARGSDRDDEGGSIVGPLFPKLEGDVGSAPRTHTIARGDNAGREMMSLVNITSVTYREPAGLLDGKFAVSMATLTAVVPIFNEFLGTTTYQRIYGRWQLHVFTLTGSPPAMNNRILLLADGADNLDEVTPILIKPQPPQIGQPVDLNSGFGTVVSGNVTIRQNDGQPRGFTADEVSAVQFVRALQQSQGKVNTGRQRGIATQILGRARVFPDGSMAAKVPANVPLQFQLLNKQGVAFVMHKPWVHVAPDATLTCTGCHAGHSLPASVTTLLARQGPSSQLELQNVRQFEFEKDIQPIFDAKCVMCHDSAKVGGAAGRTRDYSFVSRKTPAGTSEAWESLTGGDMEMNALVSLQNPRASRLMWWLEGLNLETNEPYPTNPVDKIGHSTLLTSDEKLKLYDWIAAGNHYRVVDDGKPNPLRRLDRTSFERDVYPILRQNCWSCHSSGGAGQFAMNLKDPDAESRDDAVEFAMNTAARRCNFMIPHASYLLRKPLAKNHGGLGHTGGELWQATSDPNYLAIHRWIASVNPALGEAPPPTDLVNVTNYPNPFRDTTSIVYGLTGAVATKVEIGIYSQTGKLIRELPGTTTGGQVIGWNKVDWDGKDKHGKTVGNDIYFYRIEAEFGDGAKKVFRGKIVKVN